MVTMEKHVSWITLQIFFHGFCLKTFEFCCVYVWVQKVRSQRRSKELTIWSTNVILGKKMIKDFLHRNFENRSERFYPLKLLTIICFAKRSAYKSALSLISAWDHC